MHSRDDDSIVQLETESVVGVSLQFGAIPVESRRASGLGRNAYVNQKDLVRGNREVPSRRKLALLVLFIVEGWPARPDLEGLRLLLALPDHGRRFRGHDSGAPARSGGALSVLGLTSRPRIRDWRCDLCRLLRFRIWLRGMMKFVL